MEPVNGNSLSKSCADIISSNCVAWAGSAVSGVCGPNPSLTQVVQTLITCCQNTNTGTPTNACFPAGWQNIKNNCVVSSQFSNASVIIDGFQQFYSTIGFPVITGADPMYRFTASGDVQLNGVIDVNYLGSAPTGYAYIDMGSVNISCLSNSFDNAQIVQVETDAHSGPNNQPQFLKAYVILLPTGQLRLLMVHNFVYYPAAYKWSISLGGVNFNI